MKRIPILLLLLVATQMVAKDKKEKISIRIEDSASGSVVSGHVPGTNTYSTTSCGTSGNTNVQGTATDIGGGVATVSGTGSSNSSTNCQTVYHDAKPGYDTYLTHVFMTATIPSLGEKEVILWCAVQWRQCAALPQGTYDAEMKGDAVWIYTFGGARTSKIKYRIVNPALLGVNGDFAAAADLGSDNKRLAELRAECAPFSGGSVEQIQSKRMPLPPKECREVLSWMRNASLDALYDQRKSSQGK